MAFLIALGVVLAVWVLAPWPASCAPAAESQAEERERDSPDYPLGRLRFPSLVEPGRPFRLWDLRYQFSDTGERIQHFESRFKWGGWAFLGGEVRDERVGLSFDTQRIELGLTEERGRYEIETRLRGPWFLLSGQAVQRPEREGGRWLFEGELALRLNRDWEILLSYLEDQETSTDLGATLRPVQIGSVGFFYQRGIHLDLRADLEHARLVTAGNFELDRDRLRTMATLYYGRAQIETSAAYERFTGRIPREQGLLSASAEVQIASHLVVESRVATRWEPRIKAFERDFGGGLTFLGRRHRFARGSDIGRRVLEVTTRAHELGYNERRVYDTDSLRALRERLAISPSRRELTPLIDALYQAQVRERNVPLWGFSIDHARRDVEGIERMTYRVFAGVPWPMSWPFFPSERAVEFILIDFSQREETFASRLRTTSREILATIELNREVSLGFRWIDPGRTPVEIARETSSPRLLELFFTYAFGR